MLLAHSGGQDSNGGHLKKASGEYHCHAVGCVLPKSALSIKQYLNIVLFNIQLLGHFKNRDNEALAYLVAENDVVVQELVAPPYDGNFPDGTLYKADIEAKSFFEAMKLNGFEYILSDKDTGTGDRIHVNSSATEWFVTFYKPDVVSYVNTLPVGFLAENRSNHDKYWLEDNAEPYPGKGPYTHNTFRTKYSDHHPIRFKIKLDADAV